MQIGHRQFVDGSTRPVFVDDDNEQYVLDDEGKPVYGTWLPLDDADEPFIIAGLPDGE